MIRVKTQVPSVSSGRVAWHVAVTVKPIFNLYRLQLS